jgi:hypothetical protein
MMTYSLWKNVVGFHSTGVNLSLLYVELDTDIYSFDLL